MLSTRLSKRILLLLTVLAAAAAGAANASACGSGGYSYAGVSASHRAFGVSAVVTPLGGFRVRSGQVAGWVGVGGPGLGPKGADEWLQVGFSGFPQLRGADLYYEVTRPNGRPTYHQVEANVPLGTPAKVAVLEIARRPNYWRVWLNGKPVSPAIHLSASHGRWAPIATAEAWDGGSGVCNGFLYRFRQVSVARTPGGNWTPLVGGAPITSSSTKLSRGTGGASFLAAQGEDALRTIAAFSP
jgi:hypothetical protein